MSEISVLDKGFVRLVDYMGNDARIVQSARVSYGAGTKSIREDKGLIDYLIRHKHTSPLEQVEFTFHIKLPLFVMAQLVRHRTSNLNQVSARYSVMNDDFYIPEKIRMQDTKNKQGSVFEELNEESYFTQLIEKNAERAYKDYEVLLEVGVAREMARMVLPQNLYTEVYWKQDLHNLLHLLKLRMDSHAQWEIQQYANAIYDIIKPIVPHTLESWERHVLHNVSLSHDDQLVLQRVLHGEDLEIVLTEVIASKGRKREVKEKINNILGS